MAKKNKGLRLPFIPTAIFLMLIGAFVLKNSLLGTGRSVLGVNESSSASFESDISGLDSSIGDVDSVMGEIETELQGSEMSKSVSADRSTTPTQMAKSDKSASLYEDEDLDMSEIEKEMEDLSVEVETEDEQLAAELDMDFEASEKVEMVREGSGLRDTTQEVTEVDGQQVVVIEGLMDKKLFGLIPVAISERMSVSPETGEVLSRRRSIWAALLDFWSR